MISKTRCQIQSLRGSRLLFLVLLWLNECIIMVVFMIIGKNEPIYEIELSKSTVNDVTDELAYLHQFILFSSLDVVNSAMWTNNAT